MVIVTIGVIAAAVFPILMSAFQSVFWARDVSMTAGEGELAMDRMAREIRSINVATDLDAAALPTSTRLKFLYPRYDGTSGTEWVTYSTQGTSLMRNTDVLATRVSSLDFSYFNKSGAVLAPPLSAEQAGSIWRIRISLTITGSRGAESLRTTVFLRNGDKNR